MARKLPYDISYDRATKKHLRAIEAKYHSLIRIVKVATQDEVAADFAEYVKATKKGPVVVTSKGRPVAVLLKSEGEDDLERLLMGHSPKLQAILEAARKRFRKGRGIPSRSHEAAEGHRTAGAAMDNVSRR